MLSLLYSTACSSENELNHRAEAFRSKLKHSGFIQSHFFPPSIQTRSHECCYALNVYGKSPQDCVWVCVYGQRCMWPNPDPVCAPGKIHCQDELCCFPFINQTVPTRAGDFRCFFPYLQWMCTYAHSLRPVHRFSMSSYCVVVIVLTTDFCVREKF